MSRVLSQGKAGARLVFRSEVASAAKAEFNLQQGDSNSFRLRISLRAAGSSSLNLNPRHNDILQSQDVVMERLPDGSGK